ncbi:MAG: hypothetical protein CMP48_01300 [Rickettsiales bacterium]|nr:hypothetical protein [Rickettsiales bacterium]
MHLWSVTKHFLISICILSLAFTSRSQVVHGELLDSLTNEPVQFAHVTNLGNNLGTLTNAEGQFRIPATIGDTIHFSIVGYQQLGWIIKEGWFDHKVTLKLPKDTVLLDEVLISSMPTEERFKQNILNYQPNDSSFWYHGVAPPKPYDSSPMTEKEVNNPLFAIMQPADFLYEKFSKQAKEKRKYHQLIQRESITLRVNKKFTRDFVQNVTGLEGDQLTSFIFFCDYSLDYLDRTPLYMIQEDLLAKLDEFNKQTPG